MGLLDNYGKGVNNLGMTPRPANLHQLILMNLAFNLLTLDKKNKLVVLTENRVTKRHQKEYAPDVIIYKNQSNEPTEIFFDEYKPLIIIEVEKSRRIKANIEKVKELYKLVKSIQEAFVYDYEKEVWYKVLPIGELIPNNAISEILQVDFSGLVKKRLSRDI